MRRLLLISVLLSFLMIGCRGKEASSSQNYEAVGVVKAIPDSRAHVNVDHEAIEGFMDAMQMFFPVLDSSVLAGVEVSDSIQFNILVENGNYAITSIKVID